MKPNFSPVLRALDKKMELDDVLTLYAKLSWSDMKKLSEDDKASVRDLMMEEMDLDPDVRKWV